MIRRYLTVVGAILAVLVGLAVWLKPKPDEIRRSVEETAKAYAKAQAASPAPLEDLKLPTDIGEVRDYIVAVAYTAKLDGKTLSCVGAFKVTVCDDHEE